MTNNLIKQNYAKWIWRHWTPLLVVEIVAFAASVVFTNPYFINYQYKSEGIIYPYNITSFSRESETEQMLQFLNSVDIKNDVIRKFDLLKHYHIDTAKKDYYTKLLNEYQQNVSIGSTEFEAVQITVYDCNSDTAYLMVEGIINSLNNKLLATQKEKSIETMGMYKKILDMKKKEIDSMSAISKQLSVQYGLVDYISESREVMRAYYQMLTTGKTGKTLDDAATQIKNMEEKGEEYNAVNLHLKGAIEEYDNILLKYDDAVRDVNKKITYSNEVAAPYPADHRTYPVRWLLIAGACLSALLFSILVLKIFEKAGT